MSKEVTVYGYNSVETSVLKNPDNIIELYVDQSSSNKRIEKLLSSKIASRLNILKVDNIFLSELLSTEKHQGIAAKIKINDFFDLKSSIQYLSQNNGSLVLILDDLDDPRNIGACLRTANASDVDMVVLSKNRVNIDSPVIGGCWKISWKDFAGCNPKDHKAAGLVQFLMASKQDVERTRAQPPEVSNISGV